MSSPVSTITSNVNLLLLDTYTIVNSNEPYVAYVSSVAAPGKIATVRDSTGNLGTNFFKIRVSTTNGVSFTDGTNFFDITQPFGYVTMSSRDRNTWNILNAYAFPDPYGISYVSTVNVRDRLTTPNVFASSFVSTVNVNAISISSLNFQATNNLFANSISSFNINSVNFSTTNIRTNSISSININSINILTSNLFVNTISTTNLFVNTISSINLRAINISTILINSSNINNTNNLSTNSANIISLYTDNIYSNNSDSINIQNKINCQNNIITNISQATILKSVQTNLAMQTSILASISGTNQISPLTSNDLFDQFNTDFFYFNPTGFSNYLFNFQFHGIADTFPTGDFGFYFYLYNRTQSIFLYGRNYNSNFYYEVKESSIDNSKLSVSYSDIFTLNGWNLNDNIYIYLNAYNNGDKTIIFNTTNLSATYQPLFS